MTRKNILLICAALITALFLLGIWVLLNPANPFTRLFQAKISETDAQVVVGPYPADNDMKLFKQNQVGLIVSLLDARLPYEKILLEREKILAEKNNLRFLNFPMSSVLGQHFGNDYDKNAQSAADAIALEKGKVYLHCYLGVHRAKVVQDLLQAKKMVTAKYKVQQGERSTDARLLDQAQASFDAGRFSEAMTTLDQLPRLETVSHLLYGWAAFKTEKIPEAQMHFTQAMQLDPVNSEAHVGLGYCALRKNDLENAELYFSKIKDKEKNAAALTGLGIVCFRQHKFPEAKKNLTAAIAINPNNAEAKELLAKLPADSKP